MGLEAWGNLTGRGSGFKPRGAAGHPRPLPPDPPHLSGRLIIPSGGRRSGHSFSPCRGGPFSPSPCSWLRGQGRGEGRCCEPGHPNCPSRGGSRHPGTPRDEPGGEPLPRPLSPPRTEFRPASAGAAACLGAATHRACVAVARDTALQRNLPPASAWAQHPRSGEVCALAHSCPHLAPRPQGPEAAILGCERAGPAWTNL